MLRAPLCWAVAPRLRLSGRLPSGLGDGCALQPSGVAHAHPRAQAARLARAAPKRRCRPRRWIEENRPPAEVGPPIAQPGWPFVVEPRDGNLTRVAAALEVWQARLPREATRRRTRGDYPRPQILYKWDATSGEAHGWFPGAVTLALGADKGFNFEIDLSPRRRGCPIPKESVSTVDAG